jgi:hypothetical protein
MTYRGVDGVERMTAWGRMHAPRPVVVAAVVLTQATADAIDWAEYRRRPRCFDDPGDGAMTRQWCAGLQAARARAMLDLWHELRAAKSRGE